MVKRRRSSAKAALGQQEAELKRSARGKQFAGQDTGAQHAREEERAKVHRMQIAAREAAMRAAREQERAAREQEARRAHEQLVHRPLWEGAAGLVLQSARLASTVLALP